MAQGKVVRLNGQIVEDLEKIRENQIVEVLARKNYIMQELSKLNKSGSLPLTLNSLDLELNYIKNQSLSDLIQLAVYSYLNDNKEEEQC